MRLVALSDTHTYHREVTVPDGDVLIFGGDLMSSGYKHSEVKDFADWWNNLPHKYKLLVAGNHDRMFETNLEYCLSKFTGTIYLQDSGIEINGVKFWGSPYQPWFYDWAFNVSRGEVIKKHWDLIPSDTDVLITHGPPYGVLDQARPNGMDSTWGSKIILPPTEHCGCEELGKAVYRIKPKVHIFGHIHGSYGSQGSYPKELMIPKSDTRYFNASICNEQYNPANEPHVIDLD